VVVGRGRLGRSLAGALPCPLLPGRETEEVPAGCLCLIAVPDPALAGTAARLRGEGAAFVHVSGARGLEALETAARRGHPVGAFHPLRSFPAPLGPEAFRGVLFGIDASDAALLAELEALGARLGGWTRRIEGGDRVRYHAAATLAGPLLVALAAEAAGVLGEAGFAREEALDALLPFIAGTVDNLRALRLPGALIGPVRRGDPDTVARHVAALHGDALAAYRALTRTAVDLAEEAGLDAAAASALRELVAPPPWRGRWVGHDPEGGR
jgi:predicted short-subunit dehydrogenase-like oxidoreductase (DUF2520 family)